MSTIDLSQLSSAGRNAVAMVKEGGVVVICLLIVAFFFGQRAGWIPDIEQQQHARIVSAISEFTGIMRASQELQGRQIELMERNQRAQLRITRGLCMSVTKTSEAENRCLGDQ